MLSYIKMDNKWITKFPDFKISKKKRFREFLLSNIYGKKFPKIPHNI